MFFRYELEVYTSEYDPVYKGCFSSINHLVKFASGFDDTQVNHMTAFDIVFERQIPIVALIEEFRGNLNGI